MYGVSLLLLLIFITLVSIELKMKRQIQQSKDIETAIYRLIVINKEQHNSK